MTTETLTCASGYRLVYKGVLPLQVAIGCCIKGVLPVRVVYEGVTCEGGV